ncbi:MAG: flagellar motor switch protein FliM [Gammaproteobacteria bacterium]|jgi:flagellar motor switch protein FliM
MANSDLLSQEEIDALLSGVDGGDVETEAEEQLVSNEVRSYDLASEDRIAPGEMPALEMINERFARNLRLSLFNLLRRSAVVSVEGIELHKFGEYAQTLLMPSNLNIIKIAPLHGSALVVFAPKLVFSLVDCFFGGDGRFHTKIEGRDFTATEMRIVQKALNIVFEDMKEAWEPVLPIDFQYIDSEINPQFANIIGANEVIVVCTFHVDVDAGAGHLQFALPYSMLEPIRVQLDAGIQSEAPKKDPRWNTRLQEELKSAKIKLQSTLATTDLTVRDIVNLKTGDIINIEMPDSVLAFVEHVPVFRGKFGASRGNRALKVVETLLADGDPAFDNTTQSPS